MIIEDVLISDPSKSWSLMQWIINHSTNCILKHSTSCVHVYLYNWPSSHIGAIITLLSHVPLYNGLSNIHWIQILILIIHVCTIWYMYFCLKFTEYNFLIKTFLELGTCYL